MKFEIATRCIAASAGQDRVFARIFDDVAIVALADGVGGRPGGGEAASLFVSEASKIATEIPNPRDAESWAAWMSRVDTLIRENQFAGETTAIIAAIGPDRVAGASVGDSQAWLVGDVEWKDLTQNQVQRPFLGSGAASPRPFFHRMKNEVVLLASDGLTKYADVDQLLHIIRESALQGGAEKLIAAVQTPSGTFPDDVSCILARVQAPDFPIVTKKKRAKFRLGFSLGKSSRISF